MNHPRLSREELLAAAGRTVPDVIAPDLRVLFCGINPGLYTAAVGHHFARPGNRFWPALHLGGFTPRLLSPWAEGELPAYGCGITNVVDRATATAKFLRRSTLPAAIGCGRKPSSTGRGFWPCWESRPIARRSPGRGRVWGCRRRRSGTPACGCFRTRAA